MNESPSLNAETRLPRQVFERAERARQALKPKDETPIPAAPAAESTPPANAIPEPPKEPAPSPPVDPRESDPAYWKQRFMSVDGLWRQDRIRFKEQIRLRDEQIVAIQADLDKAKSQSAATGDVRLEDHFTSDELEAMDESARTNAIVALRAAQRATRSEVGKVQANARKSSEEAAKERAEDANQRFLSRLTELVPNWPAINKDERWLAWLAEANDDGEERQELLNAAQSVGNAQKVARLFQEFLRGVEQPSPPPAPNPKPPVMPTSNGAQGAPADSNPQPAERPPTQAEVRDFYKRSSLNKVSDEERRAFEARISAMMAARG